MLHYGAFRLLGIPNAGNHGAPTTLRRVMEVILKEDVDTLGHRGDVVKVADGYGRNFLLPKKLAIEATSANRNVIEQMKQSALRRSAKEKSDAQQLVAQMEQVELVFERKVGENEHLFGSVTSSDIAHALEQKGYSVDRRKVQLDEPLKQLGEFHIPVKLHREVSAHIKVTVNAEGEQA
jgi:large subunit ribosomal protein L9